MTLTTDKVEHYRQRLLDLRRRAREGVGHVVESIVEDSSSQGNLSNAPVHLADVAEEGIVAEVQMLETENNLLREIDAALARIDDGTYGTCQNCGKEIEAARLDALPHVALCIECAEASDPRRRPKPR